MINDDQSMQKKSTKQNQKKKKMIEQKLRNAVRKRDASINEEKCGETRNATALGSK